MKKLIVAISILFVFAGINVSQAVDPSYLWQSVRLIVQGIRNTAALIDTATELKGLNLPVGFQAYIPIPVPVTFEAAAIEVTAGTGSWDKTLTIWLRWTGTWERGLEMQYNGVQQGEIIINPYAFAHATYTASQDSMHKIVYDHTTGPRIMTVYSQHPVAVNHVLKSIGVATEDGGFVTVYFTAHTDQDVYSNGVNDAYLFGAKISTANPYPCTAKQGAMDIGSSYDFDLYTTQHPWSINAGLFNVNVGYVANGQAGGFYAGDGLTYPLAADIIAANLPTSAAVEAVSISFAGSGAPSFVP